jgi:hypothetical protein
MSQAARYIGAEPSIGGTYQLPYRETQAVAYGSSVKITPLDARSESILVLFATITGAMTLTADTTTPCDGDVMIIKLPMDATGRTVTFSTGFTDTASTIVGTANSVCIVRFMFDVNTLKWVEMSRAIN